MQFQRVHKLTPEELNLIAHLHFQILSESFLNNLGLSFLRKSYSGLVNNPNNIFLTIKDKHQIIGFLITTTNEKLFSSNFMILNFFQLSKDILISSIKNPQLLVKILKWQLLKPPTVSNSPELQFFAINPKYQGKGLGTKLIKVLNQELLKLNYKNYIVGTKAGNKGSNNFYLKNNFIFISKKEIFGDKFNYYVSPEIK